MAKETIMLAKDWEPKRFVPGSFVSQKLDGVPVKLTRTELGVDAVTRQGETLKSIDHIISVVNHMNDLPLYTPIVGELYHEQLPFKDISGMVRSHSDQPDLKLYLHDYLSEEPYDVRYERMQSLPVHDYIGTVYDFENGAGVDQVFHIEEVEAAIKWANENAYVEGLVIRPPHCSIQPPGTRSWGIMRYKPTPTIDLAVASFEEAISKDGEPLGMVGRINLHYKGGITGCGPGKLTHKERTEVWNEQSKWIGTITEVQYMRDPSYDGLRQPTFQRWRPDKDTADC